jgi:glycogen synthase
VKIVLASEVFPPKAGGAGWSSRALALALADAGHDVKVVTTAEGPPSERGVPVIRLTAPTGRFRRESTMSIFRAALREHATDAHVIHAQHSLSALGALSLEPRPRTVVTVRDHWPVCFWSTRMSRGQLCPRCSTGGMWRCIEGRLPKITAPAAIPYMKWDLADKRHALGRANAVIAVSDAIARELRDARISNVHVLPNIVDEAEVNTVAADTPSIALPDRFLLFVGKLEANKGAEHLVPAIARSNAGLPLVVLGSGALKQQVISDSRARGIEIVAPGWAERNDVLRVMKRAEALVFPSTWPEPLSRVLLEALALGVPIAAMDTGGTSELIEDGVSGLLSKSADGLGDSIGRIVHDSNVRSRLKAGARAGSERFSPRTLVPRYEAIYEGRV